MSIELNNEFGQIDISTDVVAQIAGGAAVECYGIVGTLLPVITGKRRYGSALSVKTRHGNILVSERRDAGGTELFFHNLITQFVGMLH